MNNNVFLIEELLKKKNKKNFKTPQQKACWERGYLTGLLATLMEYDSSVKHKIKQYLN